MEVNNSGYLPGRGDLLDPTRPSEATSETRRSSGSKASGAEGRDSAGSDRVRLFMAELSPGEEIRHSRVDVLRDAISAGTYTIDPVRIADAMLADIFG